MLLRQTCSTWQRDPCDCILPGSSVHGIFQARILEWVAITFSREYIYIGFLGGSYCKESACNAGDLGSIPASEDLLERVGHNCATYTHTQTHIKKRERQREQTFILQRHSVTYFLLPVYCLSCP